MSDNIINTTDATFAVEVLQAKTPVLVDFWAVWCGPCRMVAPILEEIALEYAGKIKIAKVNVDENTQIASDYGIRSIPTLILFKDGKMIATKIGALSKAQLAAFLKENNAI